MTAPVCPISRSQAVPGMPDQRLPMPIRATDLPSLLAAVNAIRAILMGPDTTINNVYRPRPSLHQDSPDQHGAAFMGYPEWDEAERITDDVRVYHNAVESKEGGIAIADKTQWVDITRIPKTTFRDRNSNDVFVWDYGNKGKTVPGLVGPGNPNGAFEEDFFQRVIDVQWGGLAVEFWPKGT